MRQGASRNWKVGILFWLTLLLFHEPHGGFFHVPKSLCPTLMWFFGMPYPHPLRAFFFGGPHQWCFLATPNTYNKWTILHFLYSFTVSIVIWQVYFLNVVYPWLMYAYHAYSLVGIPADQKSKMEVHRQYLKSCILNIR